MSRWCSTLAVSALLALVVAGCGSSSKSSASNGGGKSSSGHAGPFRILDVTSLTGELGSFGVGELQGIKAATNVLNAHGGIDGHKVVYQVVDDGSEATKGVTLMTQAIEGGSKPDFINAGVDGPEGLAFAPIANQHEIINWNAAPAAKLGEPSVSPYTFVSNPSYADVGRAGAKEVIAKGYKTATVIAPEDEPAKDETEGFVEEYEKLGGKVLGEEAFSPTALNLTATFEKAYATKPEAVYVQDEGQGVAELKAHAIAGQQMPMQCDTGCIDPFGQEGLTAAQLKNTYGLGESLILRAPAERSPRQAEFIKALEAVGGEKGVGLVLPGLAYDSVMATAAAAKQAGSIEAPAIAKALEKLEGNTEWALGFKYDFTSSSHFVPGTEEVFKSFPLGAPYKEGYFDVKAAG